MVLFHTLSPESVKAVLRDGLRYGSQGALSQDEDIAKANDYLDSVRPARVSALGLSRNKCLYMYLAMNGMVHDISHGKVLPMRQWTAAERRVVLAVEVNAAVAYLSDLEAYDALARALAAPAPQATCRRLAALYWRTVLPMPEVVQYYLLQEDGLVLRQNAPGHLPPSFARVEVMVTQNVAAQAISAVPC
ncbi:MAG TPA: hypothetical protein VMY99_05280 [Nevskiaceae bacterium]|nr:hypothetical protein [Nevskiaceae bacterium]